MTAAAEGLVRLFDAEATGKLETIERIGACSDGRVSLLDFKAIQDRLGSRWELKKFDVYDLIGRIIQRTAGKAVIHAVVKESQFLVCFSDGDRADAAGLSYRIVEEVLSHFLGAVDPADVRIAYVTSIANGQITARALSSQEALVVQTRSTNALKPKPKVTPEPVLIEDLSRRAPIHYGVEAIVAIRQSTAVGYRLSATLFDEHDLRPLALRERTILSTASLLAIDLRTLLEAQTSGLLSNNYPSMMIPLSIQSLFYSRGRTAVFYVLNRLTTNEQSRLLIELVGIEEGAPSSRLVEAMALLKPFCRKVVLQTPPGRAVIANVRSVRPSAISVASVDIGGRSAKLASGLISAGEAIKGAASTLIALGLTSDALLSVCQVAGFTHATLLVDT